MTGRTQPLLNIRNLCTSFHGEGEIEKVLDHVSLDIMPGETVALAGESGSGKSVTALSVLQLLDRNAATISGSIEFEGKDLATCSELEMQQIRGNRIAMIFQEPMTSLNPVYSIGTQLMESLIIHQDMPREQAKERAIQLLARTGIANPSDRIDSYPYQLSGGQRQRVMIAMALALRPALLIADEPTTALDVTIQAQILALIKDLQKEMGMAVLLITHDLNMVRKTADRVNVMHQGKIVECDLTETVFNSPRDQYTKHLLESVPHGHPEAKPSSRPLITVTNLKCYFPVKKGFFRRTVGNIKAIDDVSITIQEGKTLGIVGESGSGKTTLGMCLLRLTGCRGEILYNDQDLFQYKNSSLRHLRKELQVVFQDPFSSLSPRLTVEQIISEGLKVHKMGRNGQERRQLVEDALTEVGLEKEMADRYPHEFSGGQRQRIAIARAIVLRPKFLVLDEPTSALDMTIQAQIIDLLKDLQKRLNITYLFISHDLRVVKAMADEVAVMLNGKIVEQGTTGIFDNPKHPYTRKLFAAAFNLEENGESGPD
ncbi:MAG: ABC transporter ATP-binding protein [Proteobacteria bacterium]|nr:ABC transporter ATP-binding protein [Pseudomonadota bacterium]MBU1739327.1 ABC transporter ATP-binding protein [Pseudomonadota bacterium]